MHNFIDEILKTSTLSPKARKEALLPLADTTALSSAVLSLQHYPDDARAISRALSDLAADKACRATLMRQSIIHRDAFIGLLESPDAKLRKNIAELLGRLDADAFCDALMKAYEKETIDFVKPSILLALGNATASVQVKPFLANIVIPKSDDKNIMAQHTALQKAKANIMPATPFISPKAALFAPEDIVLNCPNIKVTLQELSSLGYSCATIDTENNLIIVRNVSDFFALYKARSFYEAGVYMGEYASIENALSDNISVKLLDVLENLYGTTNLSYRVDIVGKEALHKERLALYPVLNNAFKDTALANNPSGYDFEIRFHHMGKKVVLGLYPGKRIDERFSYRTQSIAASMHPVVAASCLFFVKDYLKDDAAVLDPFCGAGTLLLERSKYACKKLVGSDISRTAIKAAKINAKNMHTDVFWLLKNAASPFEEQFSEVLCNMPFGLRVANHKENETLYTAFLDNLYHLLTDSGYAFLFSTEKKLLEELFHKTFVCIDKATFSAGGLYPSLFVLQKKIN